MHQCDQNSNSCSSLGPGSEENEVTAGRFRALGHLSHLPHMDCLLHHAWMFSSATFVELRFCTEIV